MIRPPWGHSPRSDKMNIPNEKITFSALKKFKIIETKFFKFVISLRGGHCDYEVFAPSPKKPSYANGGMYE